MKILMERFPYRFCETDSKDRGWIEKYNELTKRWFKMYECDSSLQLLTAMEDFEYCKWLDPDDVPCYRSNRGDVVHSPYPATRVNT
jgi:hypothetical protein